jgi:hypothetical protein
MKVGLIFMHPFAAINVQFASRALIAAGCYCGLAPPASLSWPLIYQIAYQAAAAQLEQERLSRLFWEPNLN